MLAKVRTPSGATCTCQILTYNLLPAFIIFNDRLSYQIHINLHIDLGKRS